jgi:hypothetical protein
MRRTDPILLLAFLSLFAVVESKADETAIRTAFGQSKAAALDAAVPLLRPGSRVIWQMNLAVEAPDGTRSSLRVGDTIERQDAAGSTVVLAIEFPDGEDGLYDRLRAFEPAGGSSLTEIVTVKLNAAGEVIGTRRGIIPDTAVVTRIESIELAPDEAGGELEWPQIYAIYRATYATNDWWGEILWESKIGTDPVAVLHRLPSAVSKTDRSGAALIDRPIVVVNDDIDSFSIISPERQKIVTRCAVPCVPDGRVLLGLW